MGIRSRPRRSLLAVAAAMALSTGSGASTTARLSDLSWLAGHWLECSPQGEAMETWTDGRGGVMLGLSKSIRKDRTSWELSRIDETPEGIVFFASPKDQAATAFKAVSITTGEVIFENPGHDFPQRILYVREGDRLTGRIEGMLEGKPKAIEWRYRLSPLDATCP